ncbi:hypothetical protein GCM10027060_07640 [Nesterenkonia halophila]|uniref:hypothetical protein n=1 Tax=Nesterenkonia halophila TaxID=302044 RepID=UPI0012928961|nr:hypothetical protein [Nesterenkonia halophila]
MAGTDASRILSAAGALGVASMAVFGTTAWDDPPRQTAESAAAAGGAPAPSSEDGLESGAESGDDGASGPEGDELDG